MTARSFEACSTRAGNVKYEAEQVESFDDDEPRRIYDLASERLAWIGSGTIYFNAIARPEQPEQFSRFIAEAVNPDSEKADRLVAIRMESTTQSLAAGDKLVMPMRVFLGPKNRDLLESSYYAAPDVRYNATLISPFGCTFCVFQPVVDVLGLPAEHLPLRPTGLGSGHHRAGRLGPRTSAPDHEAVAEEHHADEQAGAEDHGCQGEVRRRQREDGAGDGRDLRPSRRRPLLFGCMPMLLQTPIWIALYSTLQATFELRHEPFLFGLTWIDDLSRPDHLVDFGQRFEILPFFGLGISGINLLPLLMAVVFFIQMKLQPQPTATMTDEQKAQQKLMQILMVTVFPLFLYSMPSGLNLYILTSTTIGIIETKLIRRNLKIEEDEIAAAEAEGRTLPQKPKGPLGRRLDGFRDTIAARVAEAQKHAQAAKTNSKSPKKPRKK